MEITLEEQKAAASVLAAIRDRRAVRKYKDAPVKMDLLDQIIEAGRMAPSAMNRQPWKFHVLIKKEDIALFSKEIRHSLFKVLPKLGIKDLVKGAIAGLKHLSEGMEFMREEDMVFHGAPVVIFLSAPTDNEWAKLDVGMCAQNMMLAAKALGLDTCPVGFAKYVIETPSYSRLKNDAQEEVLLAVIMGYGDETPEMHPREKDNVTYL